MSTMPLPNGAMQRMAGAEILLVDNGSTQAAATLGLRRIAARLMSRCGHPVHPVSLLHVDKVSADRLEGRPAVILADWLVQRLSAGSRSFAVLPLFFGQSRALTAFIPEQVAQLAQRFGEFELRIAEPLVPLPQGEARMARILADHVDECRVALQREYSHVVVVDHGSPLPVVTEVRNTVSDALRGYLPPGICVEQAVMERRPGAAYDFNGRLLADVLDGIAVGRPDASVALGMLFISPGRHAGPGGDIADICSKAMARHPHLQIAISRLVGEHALLDDILLDRLHDVMGMAVL